MTFTASNGIQIRFTHGISGERHLLGTLAASTPDTYPDQTHATASEAGLKALREFFEYEANRKPWHEAKPGEVWVLTMDGAEHAWGVGTAFDLGPEFVYAGGESNMPLTWHEITAGRRIYPEVS